MSDLHPLPPLTRDLPWPMARAFVYKDLDTGLWCWYHQCAHRFPDRPFHGRPAKCWDRAHNEADFHARYCTT